MPVIAVDKDPERLTLTTTADFAAPIERVWQVWADPRTLERWWGPPGYPATFTAHALAPGGAMAYYMTSPEGERYHGWWRVTAVDAPNGFSFEDGFANADGSPNDALPGTRSVVTLHEAGPGTTRMTIVATFGSAEAMQQLLEMGMEEGLKLAVGQIDGLLAG